MANEAVQLSAELTAIAVELIDAYGGPVTFEYQTRGAVYNTETSEYEGGVDIDDATPFALIEDKGLFLGNAVVGEKKITVASVNLTKPEPGDKFKVNDEQYTVMTKGVVTYYCGASPVLYEVYGVK